MISVQQRIHLLSDRLVALRAQLALKRTPELDDAARALVEESCLALAELLVQFDTETRKLQVGLASLAGYAEALRVAAGAQ